MADNNSFGELNLAWITPILNVADVPASIAWFEKLGWTCDATYNAGGLIAGAATQNAVGPATFATIHAGYGQIFLAKDSEGLRGGNPVAVDSGFDVGANWSYWWLRTRAEVDALHAQAVRVGAFVITAPIAEPWGDYEFRLAHPDGHVFRVGSRGGTAPPAPPPVEVITNGSFEDGPDAGEFVTFSAGDTQIRGWTVSVGNIDYCGTIWQTADGLKRSIDLNGNGPGGIEQTIQTVPGATYQVTFAMAGNPAEGNGPKTLTVSATGNPSADYTYQIAGTSSQNMGWVDKTYTFRATAEATVLSFVSKDTPGPCGATLDNVRVTISAAP